MKASLLPLIALVFVSASFASTVRINTTKLPNGTVGTAYSTTIHGSGGCTPYTWNLLSGAKPIGIVTQRTTNTTFITLAGTPKKAGTFSFTFGLWDCGGNLVKQSYSVVIQSGANHVVDLSWQASTSQNITGYNVYRGTDGKSWTKVNVSLVASTLYDDSTVANSTTYYYATTAVDTSGVESGKSNAVKVVIP